MTTLLRLYWEFFKTGLFAVGGGMATLPFLKDIGESTGWYTYSDLMNMLAVSESTPGPIGINMATYVGFTQLVSTSSTAAKANPRKLNRLPPVSWRPFRREPSTESIRTQVSTSKMTDTQAAPMRPVEAGRRP